MNDSHTPKPLNGHQPHATDDLATVDKLNLETAQIAWSELQRYFAAGRVIAVGAELDLVTVASKLHDDDKATFEAWIASEQVGAVTDEQAKDWVARDAVLWAVVISPWVLVQATDSPQ